MIVIAHRPISIIVMYAIVLHVVWSVLISIDPAATNATAVNALFRYIPDPNWLAALILIASIFATIGLFTHTPWIVALLVPQQVLLMMSAAGAVEAIWLAQFADGVIRPRAFIAADQFYSILAAIGHTVAIIAHARRIVR